MSGRPARQSTGCGATEMYVFTFENLMGKTASHRWDILNCEKFSQHFLYLNCKHFKKITAEIWGPAKDQIVFVRIVSKWMLKYKQQHVFGFHVRNLNFLVYCNGWSAQINSQTPIIVKKQKRLFLNKKLARCTGYLLTRSTQLEKLIHRTGHGVTYCILVI